MKFRNENDNLKAQVKSLQVIIFGLFLVCGMLGVGWDRAKKITPLHIPPDLRAGALVKPNDAKPVHVYAFALTLIQILNHWQSDGSVDYGLAIDSVKPYLTPRFYAQLQDDLKQRIINPIDGAGTSVDELTGRVRSIQPIPGQAYEDQRVTVHGNGTWTVNLDLHIDEEVKGMNVKAINVRYPVRVVTYDVDTNANPWGLALDGYAPPGPRRIAERPGGGQAAHLGQVPDQRFQEPSQ
jgi:integrating conjugative element protein (TIGR03746 family)